MTRRHHRHKGHTGHAQRLGDVVDDLVDDLWFQRQVEKLHELGPRAYDPAELRVFIEASRRRSTSDPGPEAVQ